MSLDYKLVRSRRKTAALYVQSDGGLLVRASLKASKKLLDEFVISKSGWIEKQRHKLATRKSPVNFLDVVKNGNAVYMGKDYPVELVDKAPHPFHFDGKKFFLTRNQSEQSSKLVENWYRTQAREIINEKISFFSKKTHLKPKKLRITSAKTRWGSCSNRGTVSFTWRLIMAPPDVIDYVVVHELVHLVENNHQKPFWNKVAEIIPDYQGCRNWLRQNGKEIMENTSILEV